MPHGESAGPGDIHSQSDRLDICLNDLFVTGSAAGETLFDELVNFHQAELNQLCNSADRNHVRRPRITRHRMVYEALGDAMKTDIHALAVRAFTTEEWEKESPGG